MASTLVLGIDLGTTSIKLTLLEPVSKNVVLSKTLQSNASIATNSNYAEQNVAVIFDVLKKTLIEVPQTFLSQVIRIGICGQMHGCMLWKSKCQDCNDALSCCTKCSSSLITWQDQRCTRDFLDSLPRGKTNNVPQLSTGFGCASLFWLARNNRDLVRQYDCAGTVQDFLVAKLCELDKPVMSTHNAVSWGYCDAIHAIWDKQLLQSQGFPVHLLPDIQIPGQFAGNLKNDCCGLPQGTTVGIALGDLQCSVLASMDVKNEAVLNIGTSSQMAVVISHEKLDQFKNDDSASVVQLWPFFDDEFVAVAASLTGGNILSSFVDMLQSWMNEIGITTSLDRQQLYSNLLQCALSKDNTSLEIRPVIWGERHDTSLTGQASQITSNNISLGDVTLALLQGIVQNLHSMISSEKLASCGVQRIVGTGSALTKNPVLQRQAERLWKLPLITKKKSDASLGAALAVV